MALANVQPIIERISTELFKAEFRRLDKHISVLSRLNREAVPTTVFPFMYKGKVYVPQDAPFVSSGPGSSVGLAFGLSQEMEDFLSDKSTVERDKKLIEQMIFKLLYQCNCLQEIRDALPECLVSLVPQLEKMPREKDQHFIIRHDERAMRQFTAILPKMEFYSVARLMY